MQTTSAGVPSPDAQQLGVVEHRCGALCVLGGPGTGKTSVLQARYARLATSPGLSPDRILVLVPNRGQKIRLQNRFLHRLLFEDGLDAVVEVPVYTWHGLANHLVTRHYDRLAYAEPPVLLTSPEQWGDIRDALAAEPPGAWPEHGHLLNNRGFVDEIVDFCIRAEQRLLDDRDLAELERARPQWGEVIRFFKAHSRRLRARSRVDYPTLLRDAVELIANHDDIRSAVHQRWPHVLVDDAQELSFVQQRFLHFLASPLPNGGDSSGPERSLVVAGDPDSAIETFRGADPGWLDRFKEGFGGAAVTLQTSYRLGAELGAAAAGVLERSSQSSHRPVRFAGDAAFEVAEYPNAGAELQAVARRLRLSHLTDGTPYEDMAILLTSPRAMLPALERALNAAEVPFSVGAPDRPLEREPAVVAIRMLARWSFGTADEDDLVELLRSPLVGLRDEDVRDLQRQASLEGRPLRELLERAPERPDPRVRAALSTLTQTAAALRAARDRPADEAFWAVWETNPHYRSLIARARRDLADPTNRELDALVTLSRALGRFVERRRGSGTLEDYFEAIGRADFGSDPWLPPERARGGVEVLSFHSAKGRQWSLVAVCGCVEGSIPKGRRAQGLFDPYLLDVEGPAERRRRNEAEDRRVFYVALTRATQHCLVTTSPGVSRKGRPSRFLKELVGEAEREPPLRDLPPLTFTEAAARYRRDLMDVSKPAPERLAALASVARVCELDPRCAAARPNEWWWRWDWTEGRIPIRAQSANQEDAEGVPLPPDKLRTSYSKLSNYDNCGLNYLGEVVLGLDPDTSYHMAFGKWMHAMFEEIQDGRLEPEQGAVLRRYREWFDESIFPNRAVASQFRRDGEKMLQHFIAHLMSGRTVVNEHPFRVDLNGHVISGRIDRVDKIGSNIVVMDYKTSRKEAGWDEAKQSLQLAIYYLAATKDPEVARYGRPVSMQLVYPFKLVKGDVAKRCQTPEQAEAVLAEIPRLLDGVLQEDFRPNPEADCYFCKLKPLCPLWPEGRELTP